MGHLEQRPHVPSKTLRARLELPVLVLTLPRALQAVLAVQRVLGNTDRTLGYPVMRAWFPWQDAAGAAVRCLLSSATDAEIRCTVPAA